MSNGPLPTTLTFLSHLPTIPTGSKVRFLGCVTHYALSRGTLSLEHTYPSPQAHHVIALVDLNLVLEGLKREDIQVGAWVNVIGYVGGVARDGGTAKKIFARGNKEGVKDMDSETLKVDVKAVMLWGAGGVRLGEYEKALEERLRDAKGNVRRSH